MNFATMPGLLPALRNVFGEAAVWDSPAGPVPIVGRFRIDPYDVPLGGGFPEGLNVTQTWLYVDRKDIPSPETPHLGELLSLRKRWWEIVQIDADDIGELGFRLIHAHKPVDPVSHRAAD